jgi:hypothetical protein
MNHDLLVKIVELCGNEHKDRLHTTCEVIEALAHEWHGSYVDLLDAATALQR